MPLIGLSVPGSLLLLRGRHRVPRLPLATVLAREGFLAYHGTIFAMLMILNLFFFFFNFSSGLLSGCH